MKERGLLVPSSEAQGRGTRTSGAFLLLPVVTQSTMPAQVPLLERPPMPSRGLHPQGLPEALHWSTIHVGLWGSSLQHLNFWGHTDVTAGLAVAVDRDLAGRRLGCRGSSWPPPRTALSFPVASLQTLPSAEPLWAPQSPPLAPQCSRPLALPTEWPGRHLASRGYLAVVPWGRGSLSPPPAWVPWALSRPGPWRPTSWLVPPSGTPSPWGPRGPLPLQPRP